MSRSSTLVLFMTLCCLAPARAATITVTSDSGGTGGPDCTLRDAITAANTDTATGGCAAGNGADTIELPARAVITLTEGDNWSDGPTGLPAITSEVIINGNGSTIERDEGDKAFEFRIFAVGADGVLTLKHLTVSNGSLSDWGGGGILNFGSLTLTDSTVSGNVTGCCGGGIVNDGVLTMTGSTLSNNEASIFGGGIFNVGTATATNSTISGNVSSFHGGGISNSGAFMLINSTISGNVENHNDGGGIWNNGDNSVLTLIDSTVSENTANNGGGISVHGALVTLTGSTVCGNQQDQILGPYTDGGGNLVVEECPACTLGDLDGDGSVGAADLAILLGSWGSCAGCPADVNDDSQVDAFDLATLLSVWGPCR